MYGSAAHVPVEATFGRSCQWWHVRRLRQSFCQLNHGSAARSCAPGSRDDLDPSGRRCSIRGEPVFRQPEGDSGGGVAGRSPTPTSMDFRKPRQRHSSPRLLPLVTVPAISAAAHPPHPAARCTFEPLPEQSSSHRRKCHRGEHVGPAAQGSRWHQFTWSRLEHREILGHRREHLPQLSRSTRRDGHTYRS